MALGGVHRKPSTVGQALLAHRRLDRSRKPIDEPVAKRTIRRIVLHRGQVAARRAGGSLERAIAECAPETSREDDRLGLAESHPRGPNQQWFENLGRIDPRLRMVAAAPGGDEQVLDAFLASRNAECWRHRTRLDLIDEIVRGQAVATREPRAMGEVRPTNPRLEDRTRRGRRGVPSALASSSPNS